MAIEIAMPALGLTMTEGTIQAWLKRVGEPVRKEEPLFTVETDKAVTEVVSPADGVLGEILVPEGATAPVHRVIAYLTAPGETIAKAISPAVPAPPRDQSRAAPRSDRTQTEVVAQSHHPANSVAVPVRSSNAAPTARIRTTPAFPPPVNGTDGQRLLWMYRAMLRIRQFDERVVTLFAGGKIAGALHSYVGEEAVAAGVCVNLRPDDYIVSTHRGHGHLLAKGGDMKRMMAELFGRIDGYCRGKGGSMHIVDVSLGILGANGIVGAGIPIATGAGTAIRLQGGEQVVVAFFGDGATNIGTFHEGVNLAATWNLPVVFVCENNLYAQFTPLSMHARTPDLHVRAQAYGIPGLQVDGNDAAAVATVTADAIDQARRGLGPILVEAKTFRWYGHAINNPASALGRDADEIASWKARDPIPRLAQRLLESGIATAKELAAIQAAVVDELEEAIRFAEASPPPAPEDALEDVYTELPPGAAL